MPTQHKGEPHATIQITPQTPSVGIAQIGTYIPTTFLSIDDTFPQHASCEEKKRAGFFQKPVETSLNLGEMAMEAIKDMCKRVEFNASQKHYVLFCSTGLHPHPPSGWALRIAKELQLPEVFAFDISNGCNAPNTGLKIAFSFLSQEPQATVLLVVADKLSHTVDPQNPLQHNLLSFADAAAAVLLTTDHKDNHHQILGQAFQTSAEFCDFQNIDPLTQKIITTPISKENLEALLEKIEKKYTQTILEALHQSQQSIQDIKYIFTNQSAIHLWPKFANILGVSSQIFYNTFSWFGHMGGADAFYGFQQALRSQEIKKGDLVLIATSGFGYSWGATVLQV